MICPVNSALIRIESVVPLVPVGTVGESTSRATIEIVGYVADEDRNPQFDYTRR